MGGWLIAALGAKALRVDPFSSQCRAMWPTGRCTTFHVPWPLLRLRQMLFLVCSSHLPAGCRAQPAGCWQLAAAETSKQPSGLARYGSTCATHQPGSCGALAWHMPGTQTTCFRSKYTSASRAPSSGNDGHLLTSSARMPLSRRVYIVISHSSPTCWYSRKDPFSRKGTCAARPQAHR